MTSSTNAPKAQNVTIGRGDFVIVHTGHMERCLDEKKWDGYAGGDAPRVTGGTGLPISPQAIK